MSHPFLQLSPTTLADVLGEKAVMDFGMRPLWNAQPRIAGPAFTVRCAPGDNLMLHAAIYRAAPGSVLVVEAGGVAHAVCGGNVCAVAQRRGIAAFVVDGVIRDLAETRDRAFPVIARGVRPIPGGKDIIGALNGTVMCGGVPVSAGDIVVGDEEGVVAVPAAQSAAVLDKALAKVAKEAAQSLDAWEAAHRARIDELLRARGYTEASNLPASS